MEWWIASRPGAITHPGRERAFRGVPRHRFLPSVDPVRVYTDGALVTKLGVDVPISASSDPTVMAIVIELLDPRPQATEPPVGDDARRVHPGLFVTASCAWLTS